jgi:hypothetical protein
VYLSERRRKNGVAEAVIAIPRREREKKVEVPI